MLELISGPCREPAWCNHRLTTHRGSCRLCRGGTGLPQTLMHGRLDPEKWAASAPGPPARVNSHILLFRLTIVDRATCLVHEVEYGHICKTCKQITYCYLPGTRHERGCSKGPPPCKTRLVHVGPELCN